MRKRYFLLALVLACVLPLSACAEPLSALEAFAPGATDDAFVPYQSTSPNGAWILDVRKEEDEDSGMAFAAIRVLSAETGETLYDCPDRWRLWDLHGIDWLCDGTIPSIPPTRAPLWRRQEGAWQPMDAQAGLVSLRPPMTTATRASTNRMAGAPWRCAGSTDMPTSPSTRKERRGWTCCTAT